MEIGMLTADTASVMGFNVLDAVVLVVFAVCIGIGYMKGLIRAILDLVGVFLSLLIAKAVYPVMSVFLREKTGIYDNIKNSIVDRMNLSGVIEETTLAAQENFIASLPLPGFLSDMLLENNNPEIYSILNVSSIEEYVGGYIANIFINILSAVLVFLLVFVIMKIIARALDIVSRLPVIRQFNKTGGIIAGVISGLVYIWIGLIIFTMFFVNPDNNTMALLYSSKIALFLYNHNLLLVAVLMIFT